MARWLSASSGRAPDNPTFREAPPLSRPPAAAERLARDRSVFALVPAINQVHRDGRLLIAHNRAPKTLSLSG